MIDKLLVATKNRGKVVEFAEMLQDMDLEWLGPDDVGITIEVEETGSTFRENAILKARAYAAASDLLTLADDSGLVVDALDGRPGIYTARYGGAGLTHVQRFQYLLGHLLDVPWEQRTARFQAAIALVASDGTLLGDSNGVCEGMIALEPAGDGGFGYDPVFYLPELGMTMAEVGSTVKHQISHRGRALRGIEPLLRQVLAA